MKKKLTMIAALALAVCIGIGGTLAYLTSETNKVTNTFTVGNVAAELYETDNTKSDGSTTTTGNTYSNVAPGATVDKDPTIKITSATGKNFVYIGVYNPNGDNVTYSVNTGWDQVGTYTKEGKTYTVYGYQTAKALNETATLFDEITFSEDLENSETLQDMVLIGFAVQEDGFATAQAAWTATFGAPAQG